MICEKCKIIPVSKILISLCRKYENENKKRTRASIFQSSEDGKQEIFLYRLVVNCKKDILSQILSRSTKAT